MSRSRLRPNDDRMYVEERIHTAPPGPATAPSTVTISRDRFPRSPLIRDRLVSRWMIYDRLVHLLLHPTRSVFAQSPLPPLPAAVPARAITQHPTSNPTSDLGPNPRALPLRFDSLWNRPPFTNTPLAIPSKHQPCAPSSVAKGWYS